MFCVFYLSWLPKFRRVKNNNYIAVILHHYFTHFIVALISHWTFTAARHRRRATYNVIRRAYLYTRRAVSAVRNNNIRTYNSRYLYMFPHCCSRNCSRRTRAMSCVQQPFVLLLIVIVVNRVNNRAIS